MTVALRAEAYVTFAILLGANAAVRAEDGHAGLSAQIVLPFIGVRMPVHFTQGPRLEDHFRRGKRGLNGKILLLDHVLDAAFEHLGRLHVETILVRELAGLAARESKFFEDGTGNCAGTDVHLLFRKFRERGRREVQHAAGDFGRRVRDPIRDTEGAELGEVSIVESKQEVGFAGSETLQQVSMSARKIPSVAGAEFVDGGLAVGHNHRRADAAFNHVSPFRGERVPV